MLKKDNNEVDRLIKRIATMLGAGATRQQVCDALSKEHSHDLIFLCYHAALILNQGI